MQKEKNNIGYEVQDVFISIPKPQIFSIESW